MRQRRRTAAQQNQAWRAAMRKLPAIATLPWDQELADKLRTKAAPSQTGRKPKRTIQGKVIWVADAPQAK